MAKVDNAVGQLIIGQYIVLNPFTGFWQDFNGFLHGLLDVGILPYWHTPHFLAYCHHLTLSPASQ